MPRSRATSPYPVRSRFLRLGAVLLLATAVLLTLRVFAAEASATHEFVERINDARTAHGLREVRSSGQLQESSTDYSWWMLDTAYFGHSASIRVSRRFGLRGEVLARTDQEDPSADHIVGQWLASPSHRAVVLNPRFRFVGVGIARGWLGEVPTTLVTGHFGTPRTRAVRRMQPSAGH